METGKQIFKQVIDGIQAEDLDVTLKFGVILRSSFGSLLALRKQLNQKYELIYITLSSSPLYLVHWNDLSPTKQNEMLEKGKRNVEK